LYDVPELWLVQVLPPLVVTTIVPEAPTDQQSLLLTHDVAYRSLVVPEVWTVQVDALAGAATTSTAMTARAPVVASRPSNRRASRRRPGAARRLTISARAEPPAILRFFDRPGPNLSRRSDPARRLGVVARIDYERASATYDQGRALPEEVFEAWRGLLAGCLAGPPGPVLDVGAGTGIWSGRLARWFGVPVLAIEPADGMRAAARRKALPPAVRLLGGSGGAIPLRDGAAGAAWLSTVIHHLPDLGASAGELARVLLPGAAVAIRSSFPGRHDEIPLFHYFPAARRVAESFPTVADTVTAFSGAGFGFVSLHRVRERRAGDLGAWLGRVRAMRDADSTLAPLADEDFAAGLAAMEADAAAGRPAPATGLDCLVLRRTR
jgi:ubiquinone/menaquinone biosynthesis C-methylase UbiE